MTSQLAEMKNYYEQAQEELSKGVTDTGILTENMHSEVIKSYEQLRTEVKICFIIIKTFNID